MKKLSVMIILCILAIGIAANANIITSEEEATKAPVVQPVAVDSSSPKTAADRTTISILLGVGIVGLVTFSRRR